MIVADNETSVDLLYYGAIARTVVRLVGEKSDEALSGWRTRRLGRREI